MDILRRAHNLKKSWRYSVVSNFKWKIFSNFLFFSECPNFNWITNFVRPVRFFPTNPKCFDQLAITGTPPLTRFLGLGKNRVKGKLCYRRSILVPKSQTGDCEVSKSIFFLIFAIYFFPFCGKDTNWLVIWKMIDTWPLFN